MNKPNKSQQCPRDEVQEILSKPDVKIALLSDIHANLKALPNQSHYNLSGMNRVTLQKIRLLSGILRIADSLDYTHQSIVENINVKVGNKRITVECFSKTKSILEETAFNKKKDLFENVFAKKLVLKWMQQ